MGSTSWGGAGCGTEGGVVHSGERGGVCSGNFDYAAYIGRLAAGSMQGLTTVSIHSFRVLHRLP